MTLNAIKILLPALMSFSLGMFLSPLLINLLTRLKVWKQKSVEKTIDGKDAVITRSIHKDEEKKTPRMGGLIIWGSVTLTALFFWIFTNSVGILPEKLDFVSRNQTWLIIFAMIFSGILGAIDDLSSCGKHIPIIGNKGLSFLWRLLVVLLLSFFIGYWFFVKLGVVEFFVPFIGFVFVGSFIYFLISFFTVMMFSVSNIDGIDGLSGGLFAIAFASYGIIATSQNQIDIAAFCFAMVGSCCAFLWYNVAPAKYYNSETGILALTISLTLVAFLTNNALSLVIITLPLLSAPVSAVLQILSKKFLGKKIFTVAPLHHNFQANGMQSSSVVMHYWLVGLMCAFVGIIISLAGSL